MKKHLLSLLFFTFFGLYASQGGSYLLFDNETQDESIIPRNIQIGINEKVKTLIDSVKIKKENDATYMTDAQFVEYKSDLNIYKKAIEDAVYASPEEISSKLQKIAPWNTNLIKSTNQTHILVISWMSKWAYENFYKLHESENKKRYITKDIQIRTSGKKDIYEYLSWVTIPYETQRFIHSLKKTNPTKDQLQKRLTQRFGLPPEEPGHYTEKYFVELWVKPEDLIRPCINNNLLSNSCAADLFPLYPEDPFKDLFAISATKDQPYQDWYKKERSEKYKDQFMPWTRLGYTFDWGTNFQEYPQKSPEKGFTEFIVKPGSEVIIEGGIPTHEYTVTESEV
jgi:hypothetical protein